VNEAKLMDCVDGKYTFCDIEPRDILGESVIFNEHSHEITAREELHDKIQRLRILEGIKQLNHPMRVGLGQNIALGTDVRQLRTLLVACFCHNEERHTWSFFNISSFFNVFMA
jgi:hypothetical protein